MNKTLFNSLGTLFTNTQLCFTRRHEGLRNLSLYSIVSAKNKCDYTSSTINNDNNNDINTYNIWLVDKTIYSTNQHRKLGETTTTTSQRMMNWISENNVEDSDLSSCFGLCSPQTLDSRRHFKLYIDAKLVCNVIFAQPISRPLR